MSFLDLSIKGRRSLLPSATAREFALLFLVIVVSLGQGLYAISQLSYFGQDFTQHRSKILLFETEGFSLQDTNPIGLYLLGHLIRVYISRTHVLEFTSAVLLMSNLISIYFIHVLLKKVIVSHTLRSALLLLIVFLPFRVIHSVVLAPDGLVILPFMLIVLVTGKLLSYSSHVRYYILHWIFLSFLTSLSLYFKFTFVGLLPALFVVLVIQQRIVLLPGERRAVLVASLISLAIPSVIFLEQMHESYKQQGATTHVHWRKKEQPPSMTVRDIIFPKLNDLELFQARSYWNRQLRRDHQHSYIGLLYYSSFFDAMLFFQDLPEQWTYKSGVNLKHFPPREWPKTVQRLGSISLIASLPLAFLSLIGVVFFFCCQLGPLWNRNIQNPYIFSIQILSLAFHAPILFSLPYIKFAYKYGYWLPRLIMPSLIGYLILGFCLLDQTRIFKAAVVRKLIFFYSAFLSILYFWIL